MELCRTYGALEWGGVSFGDRVTPCPALCRAYSTLIRNIEIHYSLFTIHYSLSSPPYLEKIAKLFCRFRNYYYFCNHIITIYNIVH